MTRFEPQQAFATLNDLSDWLADNHATASELWVRLYKKQSGRPSVTWEDCVIAGLMWGWIDGQRQALDDVSYLQRISPRRARSAWSKKNCDHVDRLTKEGRMQPSGLSHVAAAKADGRWDQAYAGSSQLVIPDDFLAALEALPEAKAFYATLNRANLFAIYYRLHSAKKPETRSRRMAAMLETLARHEKLV